MENDHKNYTERLLSPGKEPRTHEIDLTTLVHDRATEFSPLMTIYVFGGLIVSITAISLFAIFCTIWVAVIYYNNA